jgi:hypothetical protein
MTHDRHDHESVQDVTYVLAQTRITDLRADGPSAVVTGAATTEADRPGVVARTRDAVGRRLIRLGGSLVVDENLRRRALHL